MTMTTTATPPPQIDYTTDGAQQNFSFPFPLLQDTDLQVYLTPAGQSYDPVADLVSPSLYTVSINVQPQPGGEVSFATIPDAGQTLVILRNMVLEDPTNFASVQKFSGLALDNVIYRLVLLIQDTNFLAGYKALHYPINTPVLTNESTEVGVLADGQIWKKVGDKIIGVTPQPGDEDTLRSELASKVEGGDGARLIGYFNTKDNIGEQLNETLDKIFDKIENVGPSFPLIQSMAYTKADNALGILFLQYRTVSISAITKVINLPFEAGTGNGSNIGGTPPTSGSYGVYLITGTNEAFELISDIGTCAIGQTPVLPTGYQNKYLIGYFVYGFDSVQCENQLTFIDDSPVQGGINITSLAFNLTTGNSPVIEVANIANLSSVLGFNFYQCFIENAMRIDGIDNTPTGDYAYLQFLLGRGIAPTVAQVQASPYQYASSNTATDYSRGYTIVMNTIFPAYKEDYSLTVWGQAQGANTTTAVTVSGFYFYRIKTLFLDLVLSNDSP